MPLIPKTMRAAVYRGVNDIRIETVPVPQIGRNELLVKVAACGVCPTDIKKIHYGTVPPPRIFGHETAGTIVQIGKNISSLSTLHSPLHIGDRVALHHHIPCMGCHYCRHHAFAQCETYKRTGITAGFEPAGGGFAEYVRVMPFVLPGVVKIPPKNTFEEGAMLEPVNTVLKAVKRLNLLRGDNVLVAGQGPIGLMFTRLLKLIGMNVLATDLLDSRLKLAKKFGARWTRLVQSPQSTVHSRKEESRKQKKGSREEKGERRDLKAEVRGLSSSPRTSHFALPTSLDAAVLTVPSDAALHQAMQLVRGAGQVLLFAHTKRGATTAVDLATVCVDEKDLIGSYSSDFTLQREVAKIVFSRQLDVRDLITHRFALEDTAAAIALAAKPTEESLKVLVQL